MTKTKTTKRALFASVLSLLLCVSMLIGSTFAWFTDTATTGVNKIQAGKLDITLLDKNGDSLEGKTIGFVKENGDAITGDIFWEPGCRYLLQPVTVKNNGDLWVKYTVVINGYTAPDGEVDLADVIDVYEGNTKIGTLSQVLTEGKLVAENALAPGASDKFTGDLKLVMQTTAGNEYQGKSISGVSITVFATQYTKENDSFDDQYDKDANYANGVAVNSEEELKSAIAENKSIVLNSDIALTDGLDIPVTYSGILDLNGKTLSYVSNETTGNATITNNGTLTIQDSATNGKITYHSSSPDSTNYSYGTNTISNCGNLTIINGVVENTTVGGMSSAIDNNSSARAATLTVNGGEILSVNYRAIRQFANSTSVGNTVTVNAGTVKGGSSAYGLNFWSTAIWVHCPSNNGGLASLTVANTASVGSVKLTDSGNASGLTVSIAADALVQHDIRGVASVLSTGSANLSDPKASVALTNGVYTLNYSAE